MTHTRASARLAILITTLLLPSAAFAAPVEVTDSGGNHCGTPSTTAHAASGGCGGHGIGAEVTLVQHINGVPVARSSCNSEGTVHIGENAEGWITNQVLTQAHPDTTCGPQPCAESGGGKKPWHVQIDEPAADTLQAVVEFCLTMQVAAGVFCHVSGDIQVDIIGGPPYSTEVESNAWAVESNIAEPTAAQPNCNGFIGLGPFEIDGHWTFEQQNMLLIH